MCEKPKYKIEIIKNEERNEIINFLRNTFFKDEPLVNYIQLGECEEAWISTTQSISDNCSFKAVTDSGEIIGVLINCLHERFEIHEIEILTNEKLKKIHRLFDKVYENFNLFSQFSDINKSLESVVISVDSKYRRLGVAENLINATINFMRSTSLSVIHVLCTSEFSAKAFYKLNFEEIYKLSYKDFIENGEPVFIPAEPHVACKIMAKRI